MKKVGKPDSLFATLMGISAGYYVWHQQLTILDGIFSHLVYGEQFCNHSLIYDEQICNHHILSEVLLYGIYVGHNSMADDIWLPFS